MTEQSKYQAQWTPAICTGGSYAQLSSLRAKEKEIVMNMPGSLICNTSRNTNSESIAEATKYENRIKRWELKLEAIRAFSSRLFGKSA